MKQPWFKMAQKGDVAEIQIIDFIGDWVDDYFGFGVTAKQFVDQLAALPESVKTVRVRINSPGGDVFGAINIANALRDQRAKGRKVETVVDGLAASAATLVMMAGDPIRVADNALVMIHNPWTVAMGSAEEMRKQAEVLDQVRDTIVATYQWHADLSDEEIVALMDAETWMTADDAVAMGFATEKVAGLRAAASIDPASMKMLGLKVPSQYADRVSAWQRPDESAMIHVHHDPPVDGIGDEHKVVLPCKAEAVEILEACADAGLDLSFAARLANSGVSRDDLAQLVSAEGERVRAETERVEGVKSLCVKFRLPQLAEALAGSGVGFDAAKTVVAKVTALMDRVEIDAGMVEGVRAPRVGVDVQAVYERRARRES